MFQKEKQEKRSTYKIFTIKSVSLSLKNTTNQNFHNTLLKTNKTIDNKSDYKLTTIRRINIDWTKSLVKILTNKSINVRKG